MPASLGFRPILVGGARVKGSQIIYNLNIARLKIHLQTYRIALRQLVNHVHCVDLSICKPGHFIETLCRFDEATDVTNSCFALVSVEHG